MKKLFLFPLLILLIIGFILAGCAVSTPTPTAPTTAAPTSAAPTTTAPAATTPTTTLPTATAAAATSVPSQILIGSVVSFTGDLATFGINEFGVEAAFDDMNAQGGVFVKQYNTKIPVKWIPVDCQSDTTKVAPLAEDLILRQHVNILGLHTEIPPVGIGIAQMAEKYKVPALIAGGPIDAWIAIWQGITGNTTSTDNAWKYVYQYVFANALAAKSTYEAGQPGFVMGDIEWKALEQFGAQTNKKLAMFAADDIDSKSWYQVFSTGAKSRGYTPYGADKQFGVFAAGTTDFSPLISEWKNAGCDILWGNCGAVDYGTLWRQCHTLGFQPKMVFATRAGGYYNDLKAWGGDLPNGVMMEIFWNPGFANAVGIGGTTPQSLYQRFYQKTGQPLAQGIGQDYAAAQVIFDAIQRAGTLDPNAILSAIGSTDLQTMDGRVVFEPGTKCYRQPVAVGQWQKTTNPWVWESPTVLSDNPSLPATSKIVFPVPY